MSALSSTLPTPLPTRPPTPRTPLDPRSLTSPSQITQQLALLTQREQELTLALNALISDTAKIDGALGSLKDLSHEVEHIAEEVDGRLTSSNGALGLAAADGISTFGGLEDHDEGGLVGRVSRVWETSERVGGKVRRLDDEVGRVRQAADIVTEVIELKNALQTVENGIEKEDWELATRACKRAMSVRPEVISGNFAEGVVPTSTSPLPPPQALASLRQTLLDTFQREFDAAAARKDEQAVSRFFRLWPGIGAEEEGLHAYGSFVVGLVKARGTGNAKTSSPLYYLTGLTSLLESIALIIDQHQPVVEKYYGSGRMRAVIGKLQAEGDRVVQNLIEGWEEERRVGRLISDTKQSKFPLLANPSLLPPLFAPPPAPLTHGTHHGSTPALPNLGMLSSYAPGAKKPVATPTPDEVEGPDPRDVDRVLGELVALGGRWALYRRFVWGRLTDEDTEDAGRAEPTAAEVEETLAVISNSASQKAIENLLRTYYEPLEVWFLRSSIEKAHRLDNPDVSSRPHLSSSLDDTFYLLKLVLHRVISSGSFTSLKAMRAKVSDIVERDYVNVLKRKMEAVYSGAAASAQTDRGEKEKRDKELRETFIIYLNNLDVSADYMERLIEEVGASNAIPQVFLDVEIAPARAELSQLAEWGDRFRTVVKNGVEQLFNQLTRPKLRGLLDDCYKGVSYVLDEDSFAEAEIQDIVRKRFIKAWDGLVEGHKSSFTDHNYQLFFNMTVEVLVRPWEKMVMSMKFTELGAIRYDRDVRAVANYLSSQTSFGGARDKLTRLQQIGTLLNLDADEDPAEFYSNSGIPWRLSRSEYTSVIGLRIQ